MTINDIKTYMAGRPYIDTIPTDEELTKYMNFAQLIIELFYDLTPEFINSDGYKTVISEEVIYLTQINPTEDVFAMYNFLQQFRIDGVVSGTVRERIIDFLSDLVKLLMKKFGFVLELSRKAYYGYNIF